MLIRANTLAKGLSGVRIVLIETLLEMLNRGVHPMIPSQGSLGSSGDLSPLSHLGLVFSTDEDDLDELSGQAEYKGTTMSGKTAMQKAGIPRLILQAKEGIAINNGATFSAAIAALACFEAQNLLSVAEIALSMSLEALLGLSSAFDPGFTNPVPIRGKLLSRHESVRSPRAALCWIQQSVSRMPILSGAAPRSMVLPWKP